MRRLASGLLLLLVVGLACAADPAYTDPKEAGSDFAVQGEYRGQLGGEEWGAQVIALGDGKFDVVGFAGGLPGDGWKRGDKTNKGTGELKGDVAELKGENWTGTIKDGVFSVIHDGEKVGDMNKVQRKSPTLGAKPPQGAIVLFDGSSADQFENGKLTEDGLLAATGQVSKHKFQDHTLHLEFRTPFMPKSRGQGRGNSGVYVQGSEVQVLDSFGLNGEKNECGAFYGKAKPAVNMCLPPLSWQTYDVELRPGKEGETLATVWHNGVKVHEDFVIKSTKPAGIHLQNHGNPVAYRNIWIVPASEKK
jgi:3-keto-disaccharide hydrolase